MLYLFPGLGSGFIMSKGIFTNLLQFTFLGYLHITWCPCIAQQMQVSVEWGPHLSYSNRNIFMTTLTGLGPHHINCVNADSAPFIVLLSNSLFFIFLWSPLTSAYFQLQKSFISPNVQLFKNMIETLQLFFRYLYFFKY